MCVNIDSIETATDFLSVCSQGKHQEHLQKVADSIATQAFQLAFDPDYMSPFSINAAANGFQVQGKAPRHALCMPLENFLECVALEDSDKFFGCNKSAHGLPGLMLV